MTNAEDLQLGSRCLVMNTDGTWHRGIIVDLPGELARHVFVDDDPLNVYWDKRGHDDVHPDEQVVTVDVGSDNAVLDYPESKVESYNEPMTEASGVGPNIEGVLIQRGYRGIGDLQEASQEELAEVNGIGNALAARIKADVGNIPDEPDEDEDLNSGECPECGCIFGPTDGQLVVEGDEGELYCSLECLNDAYT